MAQFGPPVEVLLVAGPRLGERRRDPRNPSGKLSLVGQGGSAGAVARRATVVDVSMGGIALRAEWPCEVGTLLKVAALGWPAPRVLQVRVVRSRPDHGAWVHGCVLDKPLGDRELSHWRWAPTAESAGPER
jgi:PilZ domain